jgi:hypothetical protein
VVARAQEPPQRQVVHLLVAEWWVTFRISDAADSLQYVSQFIVPLASERN